MKKNLESEMEGQYLRGGGEGTGDQVTNSVG